MALTRLDNLYSSKTGKYLYVSPDDFNASDELDNRGNSPLRPFKTIQRAFIEVARYSFLPAENGQSTPDRFDQFSIMLMPGDHYIDNRPGLVDLDSGDNSRYFDAKNRIIANRQEIIDRAYGQITIDYPDFFVPGDQQTDEASRYADAYRFIQKNRSYIVDRSVAQVNIDYPDFFFPDEPQTDASSRRADAYRLIQNNRTEIIDAAFQNAADQYPSVGLVALKCKRDIGIFIDYLTLDLFWESNKWAREFTLQYFDSNGNPIANGLVGEENESVYAFQAAVEIMKAAMTNQNSVTVNGTAIDMTSWYKDLTVTGDPNPGGDPPPFGVPGDTTNNTDPAACTGLQTELATLAQIVTDVITAGNLNGLPDASDDTTRDGQVRCRRDTGFLIDAVSLDVMQGGGNVYTRKFIQNYFNASGSGWVEDGLQGEETQSNAVFNKARDMMMEAITNQSGYPYKDYTITADPNPGGAYGSAGTNTDNTNPANCSDVQSMISNLVGIATTYFTQGNLENFVEETKSSHSTPGETKCKRDTGLIIDAVAADIGNGGNGSVIAAAKSYFTKQGVPISDGLVGEEAQAVTVFNVTRDMMKKAVTNQLYDKDLSILPGPATYAGYENGDALVPNLPSGNAATCIDVQATIDTLIGIVTTVITEGNLSSLNSVQVTGDIPVFNFNRALGEWQDNSILDLSNPDNVLYKFNAAAGGAIVPRGCSLIGYDLRRTVIRPLYVPDPADGSQERTSIFNLTGGCYLWQFTIKDGDLSENSPLYDNTANVGKVYYQKGQNNALAIPEYSHHKICIMQYADLDDLDIYYRKVGTSFALFQPTIDDGDFEALPQENRIVGPLSDTRNITNIRLLSQTASGNTVIRAKTKVAHGYFKEQYVAVIDTGLNDGLNGTFKVTAIFDDDPKAFEYEVPLTPQQLGLDINTDGYSVPDLNLTARVQAEIDSVESASPYVFNCSIRSTWGQCGMWADGSKATGFKSMVVAQYTGVSLQKDDRAFIRYDEFTNTWNQASLTDAFATTAYHTKGDAYWKDDWRNFHIRASDDSFIQCVSVFAVGFFDHFLMESGGDMSITNSNSNFGNTSLHSIGFKGFSFNQDKGGFITDIVPVKKVDTSAFNTTDLKYFPLSNQATKVVGNQTKLYYSGDDVYSPFIKPATSIDNYRLGALTNDKLFLKLPKLGGGNAIFESTVSPSGFKRYQVSLETLNPDSVSINNNAQDASNLIEANKEFIQAEAYKYIITKYPELQTRQSITIQKCERDIGYLVDAVVQDLRLGGNINTIQVGEGYYVGGQLSYIGPELNETIEAFDYAKNIMIAAMRNFDYLIRDVETTSGSSYINVGNTQGLLVGMRVTQYEYNATNFTNGRLNRGQAIPVTGGAIIPQNAYIRKVIDSEKIEIGNSAPVLTTDANGLVTATFGNAVTANTTQSSGVYLHFEFPQTASGSDDDDNLVGGYTDLVATRDSDVLQDTTAWDPTGDDWYPECANIAASIQEYFVNIFLILNNGLTALGGTEVDAHNLLLSNKAFIAAEAYDRMLADYPGFVPPTGNPQDCKDDLINIIETVAYNIKYGGNEKVYDGAALYVTQPNLLEGERPQTVAAFLQVRDIAIDVMRNQQVQVTGAHGLTQYIDSAVLPDPNAGQPTTFTPQGATYDGTTGEMVLDIGTHNLSIGNDIELDNGAITFYCDMDGGVAQKAYPRAGIDPYAGVPLNITAVTATTVTVNVGASPFVYYTPTNASYNPSNGEFTMEIGSHNLKLGTSIKLADNSFTFTCAMDGNQSAKTYPRPGIDPFANTAIEITGVTSTSITVNVGTSPIVYYTPSSASYVPATGLMEVTIGAHTLNAGTSVKLKNNSFSFTCDLDNNTAVKTYPRASGEGANSGTPDSAYNTAVEIVSVTATTITLDVGTSSDTSTHTFVSALQDAVITGGAYPHTFVSAATDALITGGAYNHTFVIGQPQSVTSYGNGAAPCAAVAASITTFASIYTQAVGTPGLPGDLVGISRTEPAFNVATRVEPQLDTANLATRATIFTVNTGQSQSDPHLFETGTPIRLVPTVREGIDAATVDKRVIRLPKGFDTNTIYYVIAPGRGTSPEDYSDGATYPGVFTKNNTTKIMLATTKENAAAGIYMYSPETNAIDYDVQIDLYQFVLDESYDLHQYVCNFPTGLTDVIETDVPHIFDVPGTADHVQKVFFRTFGDNSTLPQVTVNSVTSEINPNQYYYLRYVTAKTFAVFATEADAVAGTPRIIFAPGFGTNFYVFADKRTSPVRFDATRDDSALTLQDQETTTGQWYVQTTDDYDPAVNIQARMNQLGQDLKDARSKNTIYKRLKDDRGALDRIYRLRYVIPKYSDGVRDPLNGFVIKARTDETRKLIPQRIVLKPISNGSPSVALFNVTTQLAQGGSIDEQLGLTAAELDPSFDYDPYDANQVKIVGSEKTESKVSFSVQSARKVTMSSTDYLELTVFNLSITDDSVRNEQFVTIKINAPQGGAFRTNTSESNSLNKINWNGFSSGFAYLQGYFNPDGTDEHYLILKGLDGDRVEFNNATATTLSQPVLDSDNDPVLDGNGNQVLIYATLMAKADSAGSPNNVLSKSDRKDYLYSDKNANVLTMTPGDKILDDDGVQYEIASVSDVGQVEDSFYIFDIEEIKRRIPNQQEGIYYLTCIKGNVSPFPTGPGVGTNFRGFRFSQPIGQLYPLDYKNDPLWFQIRPDGTRDLTVLDPPPTVCAADNFVHGLVTTNDFKNSETKEVVLDFVENPALNRYEYTTNKIEAQDGNATSGSEDRLIPIHGDSPYPTEKRLYVELRRPSIARSGNHTFEYLGFGPGNYSTGFPLRQEVVLADIQDFYAQAKREDGGIVFYTGLNSNGDLYIGNRKINAITGEETFLEKAELLSSEDDGGDIGGLVTTFELPVVFEQEITVDGQANFNNPVEINVDEDVDGQSLTVFSNVDTNQGGDLTLDASAFSRSTIASEGNIVLHQNQVFSAIYRMNPRGSSLLSGQDYSIRTHVNQGDGNTPSNQTPNQDNSTLGFAVQFGTGAGSDPTTGDILLKGEQVNRSGSLGWIYSNFYNPVTAAIDHTTAMGGSLVQFETVTGTSVSSLGIEVGTIVKIEGLTGRYLNLNGLRVVSAVTASTFQVNAPVIIQTSAIDDPTNLPIDAVISVSANSWKEVGLLGAEAIRTTTDTIGKYAVGINTVARTAHSDQNQSYVSAASYARATLDVVGNSFISGKELLDSGYENQSELANRTFYEMDNAFLVGGDSVTPNSDAALRVATTNGLQGAHSGQTSGALRLFGGGRVGINVSQGLMNHTFTVVGDSRVTEFALFEDSMAVNGGSLSTTNNTFSLIDGGATTVYFASAAQSLSIGNSVSVNDTQTVNLGTNVDTSNLNFGSFADKMNLKIQASGSEHKSQYGTVGQATTNIAVLQFGGAYQKQSNSLTDGSLFKVRNRFTEVDGELTIGAALPNSTGITTLKTPAETVNLFNTITSKIFFGNAAARLYIGAKGGNTQINNSLIVKSSTTLEGDTTMSGGLNSGEFEITRGSFGTDAPSHVQGDIDNANIDIFEKTIIDRYIDTDGASYWGGTSNQAGVQDNITGEELYYLPIGQSSTTIQFEVGSFVLIDRSVAAVDQNGGSTQGNAPVGQQYSELVQVVELTNLNNVSDAPLQVLVRRGMNQRTAGDELLIAGTPADLPGDAEASAFKFIRTDHPDNVLLVRYDLALDVSFIENNGGLSSSTSGTTGASVNTGDFSGAVGPGDILRFSDTELSEITDINTTSPQLFTITDGNNTNPVNQFSVDSTTGQVDMLGNVNVNQNFTLEGSTTVGSQLLSVTNGAGTTNFSVDSANGTLCFKGDLKAGGPNCDRLTVLADTGNALFRGGNLVVSGDDDTDIKMVLQNTTGNLTVSGHLTVEGVTESTFTGPVQIDGGNFQLNRLDPSPEWEASTNVTNGSTIFSGANIYTVIVPGGGIGSTGTTPPTHTSGTQNNGAVQLEFLKTKSPEEIFEVEVDGSMNFAGQEGFYTPTGARKWAFVGAGEDQFPAVANVNYFVSPSADTTILLPENPSTGDMIRIVDVGGNLTYDISLRMRAPNNVSVQGDNTNANTPNLQSINYNGGELVVQTPHAGFGLIFLGSNNYDGTVTGAPATTQGWWLVEI